MSQQNPSTQKRETQAPLLPQSESLAHVRVGSSRQTFEQSPGTEHATGVSTRWQVPSRLGTSQRSFPSQIVPQQYPSMQRDDEHSSPNRHAVPFGASPGVETFTKACSWRSRLDETAMSIGPSPVKSPVTATSGALGTENTPPLTKPPSPRPAKICMASD